jgi:hypothetical protein
MGTLGLRLSSFSLDHDHALSSGLVYQYDNVGYTVVYRDPPCALAVEVQFNVLTEDFVIVDQNQTLSWKPPSEHRESWPEHSHDV